MELVTGTHPTFPLMKDMVARAFALLSVQPIGARLDYGTLSDTIGADATTTRGRSAVLKASSQVLRERNVLVLNVRGFGYELVPAEEHVTRATKLRGYARNRLRRALATVTFVRLEGMTVDEVNKVLSEQTRNALLLGVDRRLSRQKLLPKRQAIKLPSGTDMIDLFRKKRA